jgi:hypothetical protein
VERLLLAEDRQASQLAALFMSQLAARVELLIQQVAFVQPLARLVVLVSTPMVHSVAMAHIQRPRLVVLAITELRFR